MWSRLGLLLFLACAPASAQADVRGWIEANRARILTEYVELLTIPNVAADTTNIRRNADRLVGMLRERGLQARLLEASDAAVPPAVYGEWNVPGATRTIVLYAHYDGQPVDSADWTVTEPFTPLLLSGRHTAGGMPIPLPERGADVDPEWRLYARSASDDKAGVMAILAAIEALRAEGRTPAFNLKIFFDGEEEAGSPHLGEILSRHRELLASDGWVIFDGPAHPSGAPQVVLGVRGLAGADVTVYGAARPLHSGHYGNWAPNPAMLLAQLLASMKDRDGRVLIEGFYDDVEPLSPAERAAIAAAPAPDEMLRRELRLIRTEGRGRSLAELINQPSLSVLGLRSADVGADARTIIPASATASLDMRLVSGNDGRRQFDRLVAHIRGQGFHVTESEPSDEERARHPLIARVRDRGGYNAERTPIDHPLVRSVLSAAQAGAAGDVVVAPTLGGSLPLYLFREILDAPTVTLSLANYDNNQHAEDENLRLGNLWEAIAIAAAVIGGD